jgi:hypothetical protein
LQDIGFRLSDRFHNEFRLVRGNEAYGREVNQDGLKPTEDSPVIREEQRKMEKYGGRKTAYPKSHTHPKQFRIRFAGDKNQQSI